MKLASARIALLALPLALNLAACKKSDDAATGTASESAATLPNVPAPAGKAWADVVSKTADGGYVMGNPDAAIKVIEFGSLTCPHCGEFAEKGFPKLRESYIASGRVSLEFRNFVRDPFDTTMAMLTQCGTPDTFYALTEQVYSNQKDLFAKLQPAATAIQSGSTPPDKLFTVLADKGGLIDFFGARGIARDQALACLAKTDAAKTLAANTQSWEDKYNISGTPTFLVNGKNVDVATWEQLEPILQRAGAR